MTDPRPAPQLPTRAVTVSAAAARAALDRLAAEGGVDLDDRVASALAHLIVVCTSEVPSAFPGSCRWLVTEHPSTDPAGAGGYLEGRDRLAEAFTAVVGALTGADPAGSVTLTLNPDTLEAC